ncbi:hypothetical protein L3X38_003049 [Prunus dulcis]|uniref:Uncharacterized protein n=1 Tax=Prunus dulcis TaxID=3755 RepID=A0AAD4WVZ4_PRUDU|nr:hypothetical protein L3X38_003049 [Prunus dulcis]
MLHPRSDFYQTIVRPSKEPPHGLALGHNPQPNLGRDTPARARPRYSSGSGRTIPAGPDRNIPSTCAPNLGREAPSICAPNPERKSSTPIPAAASTPKLGRDLQQFQLPKPGRDLQQSQPSKLNRDL